MIIMIASLVMIKSNFLFLIQFLPSCFYWSGKYKFWKEKTDAFSDISPNWLVIQAGGWPS